MHLKRKINQNRRDFRAIYQCEFCNHEVEDSGYDDQHFHSNVIFTMKCDNCGKVADEKLSPRTMPNVPEGYVI